MPTWLAFDAGSPVTSAAVARDGTLLAETSGASRSGPSLLQQIDDSLQRAGVVPAALDGIVVLSGPGSFTGIRVALATALGLRAALSVPIFALSNLAALALHGSPVDGSRTLALVDALRGEWFAQPFRCDIDRPVAEAPPQRLPAADLQPAPGAGLALHPSPALPATLAALPAANPGGLAPGVAIAASLGRLGGLLATDLEPLYLRGFTPRTPQA
jgi:tRNA threonylcarbamoyl adenosine modification protein YeaZ